MKKIKYLFVLILTVLIIPFNTKATSASIDDIVIEGMDTVSVGTSFSQAFKINFSNIKKGTLDTLGIWTVAFELDYDEDVFIVEDIYDNGKVWKSNIYKDGNKKYVISQYNNSVFNVDACVDKVLYCADYLISIKFYVKDTDKKTSEIKMKNTGAIAYQVLGGNNPEYNADDMIELEYSHDISKTLTITKPENVEIKEPNNIISNNKPAKKKTTVPSSKKTSSKTTNNKTNTQKKKSDNNNLKDLGISGYSINFAKDITTYNISIKEDINSLKIKALPEDEKATVKIVGDDDLKLNDNKVTIDVKAENGNTKSYIIEVQKETINNTKNDDKGFKLTEKQMMIGGIVIGAILLIVVIVFVIIRIRDRKMEKELDSL